jgi:hypothetical protein
MAEPRLTGQPVVPCPAAPAHQVAGPLSTHDSPFWRAWVATVEVRRSGGSQRRVRPRLPNRARRTPTDGLCRRRPTDARIRAGVGTTADATNPSSCLGSVIGNDQQVWATTFAGPPCLGLAVTASFPRRKNESHRRSPQDRRHPVASARPLPAPPAPPDRRAARRPAGDAVSSEPSLAGSSTAPT